MTKTDVRTAALDAEVFRKVMSNFATGVTVVTTHVDGRLHGFTANAVTSVSLDPLLFLVCVDKKANAHGELSKAKHFGVNVLGIDQQHVSNTFAKSALPEEGTLRGMSYRMGDTGVPLLTGSIAWLECEVHELLEGGDHTIVIGRAVGGCVDSDAPPLIFFRGRYRRIAD
jgi:flavin reductase (DIM6/NTAB) family NADH-FMN oxidoreductase RutF